MSIRCRTNRILIAPWNHTTGGVYDHLDISVFDHVDRGGPPFGNLCQARHRQPVFLEDRGRATGREQRKAQVGELLRELHRSGLVGILHREKYITLHRQSWFCCGLSLGKRDPEISINSHDFTRGAHLWSKSDRRAWETGKRKHSLFHAPVLGRLFLSITKLLERLPRHYLRREFSQRNTHRFGHKRHRARRAWIHL